ncbi:hypothetical protein ACHAQA_010084 [Verticillium albo-atrum]
MYDYHPQDDGGFWQLQPGLAQSEKMPATIPLSVTNRSPISQPKDIEWTCLSPACPAKPFKRKVDLDNHYKQAHADGVPLSAIFVYAPSFEMMAGQMPTFVQPNTMLPSSTGVSGAGGLTTTSPQPAQQNGAATTAPDKDGVGARAGRLEEKETYYCDYSSCLRAKDGFNRRYRFRQHLQDTHKEDVVKKGGKMEDSWLDGRKMSDKWWRCSKCLTRVKIEEHGWECPADQVECEKRRYEYREKLAKTS